MFSDGVLPWRGRAGIRLLAGLLAALMFAGALHAADIDHTTRKLNRLKQELKSLQQAFAEASREKGSLRSALRKSEQQAARIADSLAALETEMMQLQKAHGRADRRVLELRHQRDQQALLLGEQLRGLFASGEQDPLKLLLSLDSPQRLARMLRYQRYLSDARQQAIGAYDATLVELGEAEQTLTEKRAALTEQKRQLEAERLKLESLRADRQHALTQLENSLRDRKVRIAALMEDQKQLQQVLQKLQEMLVAQDLEVTSQPFKELKGKLPWPTSGKIRRAFGSRDNGVALEGVEIAADAGQAIKAVHTGRVVYSDWLRGYGLLLVVDHGEGYLSLYGHNQSLLKEVGDWVAVGEVIGRVGDSGGLQKASLYFAIRRHGRPIDPIGWFR